MPLTSQRVELEGRRAGIADLESVVDTISVAFHRDPVWSWAFPDEDLRPEQYRRWWPLFVGGALDQGFTWMTERAETVAVWIRPDAPELTPEAEALVYPTLVDLLGEERAPTVLQGLLQFEAAHPHDEPHYYLSFVATHDDHRGQGIGRAIARTEPLARRRRAPARLPRVEQPEEPHALRAPRLPSARRVRAPRRWPDRHHHVARREVRPHGAPSYGANRGSWVGGS